MREKILNVNIDFDYDLDTASGIIIDFIKNKKSGIIATTNPYFIISAQEDKQFLNIINNSLMSLPDGVGILYARYYLNKIKSLNRNSIFFPINAFLLGIYCGFSSYFDKNFGAAVTGVDLVYTLCEKAQENNLKIFLLGGRSRDAGGNFDNSISDMATIASQKLKQLYPKLNIIGATSQFSRESTDDSATLDYIHKCMQEDKADHIDILYVAYNPINQEKWIQRNANKIPAMISIGVGRTFDYITDTMRPPNKIYERLRIAWLYALIKQPWRINRVYKTIIVFPLKIFLSAIHK